MRIGISFSGGDRIADVVAHSKLAEEKEFEVIWWGEDFFTRDGISPLAVIALNTARIKLGTGIISHYVHHPATITTTLATLDEISNKRMILGLGTGVPHWVRYQMGIDQPRPIDAMRESVEIFKILLQNGKITFEGRVFKCRDIRLGFTPVREQVPVYLAATGTKMLQLSGEIADGVIPGGAGSSANFTRHCIEKIGMGAKRVGRSMSNIDIQQFVISSISDNSDVARHLVKEFLAWMVGVGGLTDEVLQMDGLDRNDILPIVESTKRGDSKEATKHVTDDMVDTFAAAGNSKEFRRRIQSYFEAGVKCVVLVPVGSRDDIKATVEEAGKLLV